MNRITAPFLAVTLALAGAAAPSTAAADDGDEGAEASASVSLEASAEASTEGVKRPTHRSFNVHFGIGALFGLGDEFDDNDLYDVGGQGTIGVDFVLVEPLALSLMGGYNGFSTGDDLDGLRVVFVGGGLRLRLFADENGAAADGGTIWGNLWIDAHFDYYNYEYEDHGGYNVGLGIELAIAKNFNLGPYLRFHHAALGDGLNPMMLAVGIAVSLGGQFEPDDADGDGIADDKDDCPMEPEDEDGFEDDNGCPDTDNDGDGILDADDECPDLAGVAEKNGCPDTDLDKDGIENDVDQCPEEAEDADGFEDEDGCPDTDNDGDGVLDASDQCPMEVEDEDGFEDGDGCPDADNDGDGILDASDQCPNEPETKNGRDDEDGCPDLVRVVGTQIKILQKVYFATNKDTILEKSFPVLEEVASIIKLKKDIEVRVEGHTDDKGRKKKNLDLSRRRAESVVKFFVDHGVEAERLTAEGFGQDRPIADNKTKEGRAENRRVEFHIVAPAPAPEAPEEAPEEPAEE